MGPALWRCTESHIRRISSASGTLPVTMPAISWNRCGCSCIAQMTGSGADDRLALKVVEREPRLPVVPIELVVQARARRLKTKRTLSAGTERRPRQPERSEPARRHMNEAAPHICGRGTSVASTVTSTVQDQPKDSCDKTHQKRLVDTKLIQKTESLPFKSLPGLHSPRPGASHPPEAAAVAEASPPEGSGPGSGLRCAR